MSGRVPVTFEPAGVTAWVSPGTTVLEAARQADIVVAAPCGGRGVCGACGVRVTKGALCTPDEDELLGLRRAGGGVRLACRARVAEAVTIRPLRLSARPAPTGTGATAAAAADGQIPLVAGVDLGTTSIAAALIDPATRQEISRSSVPNPQQTYGADVLSRLGAALEGSGGALRRAAEQGVSDALRDAGESAGVSTAGINRLVIAGNSAMAALLLGADVGSLAVSPFQPPAMGETLSVESHLRKVLAPGAEVAVLPPIASFVGGDALAGTLAAGMIDATRPMLLVDFGTNAEVVLAGAGSLVVASTAAGPAFEGVGISCGGPAASGAVTRVRLGDDGAVRLEVLGDGPPQWFSGSGLVSAVAELQRHGHVDASGLLIATGPLAARFVRDDSGVLAVRLGGDEGCLTLTQLDVRALQLAKAAVRVGIQAVLAAGGVEPENLDDVLIAGAFGSALEPDDLIALGVLPMGVADKTRRVGNASLEGAATIALDPDTLVLASRAAEAARHLDLARDSGFAGALVEAMGFVPYAS